MRLSLIMLNYNIFYNRGFYQPNWVEMGRTGCRYTMDGHQLAQSTTLAPAALLGDRDENMVDLSGLKKEGENTQKNARVSLNPVTDQQPRER